MAVALTDSDRALLARPLNAILTVAPAPDRRPTPRPVWFEHTADGAVEVFTFADAPKVRRVRADGWASLLVATPAGEPEYWVALDGPATVEDDGAYEASVRMARRYWDLDDPARSADLQAFRDADLVRIVIRPDRVARYRA